MSEPAVSEPADVSTPRRSPVGLAWAALAALALQACATVPTIPVTPLHSAVAIEPIRMRGPHGPLSKRETQRVLARLNSQVPDAGAFDRHLAIEQFVAGTPLYTGNRVTLLRDGPQTFGAIFAAIEAAHHYLYLEYYILQDVSYDGQKLGDLLIRKHSEGVHIDVIYDDIGSLTTPADFFQRLSNAGISVRKFNPIVSLFSINDRDHRKILVADGSTAIIGGVNLSTDYQSTPSSHGQEWHDTDLQIDGPAVIELEQLFAQHWLEQGGRPEELVVQADPPQVRGDQVVRIIGSRGGQTTPRYYATLLSAIRAASERVWVEAAYFVPTNQERQALERAARRGVDVRLLVPMRSDSKAALAVQHSYYRGLLRAGIKIYERDDGILHSKTAVMDGVWSLVGSSNFDHRSVLFNDEVDAVVIGATTGAQLEDYFLQDEQHAHQVTLQEWRHEPLGRRIHEQFWRIWQKLL